MADEEDEQFNDLKPFKSNPNPSSLESEVSEDDESGLEELGRELEGIARRILYFRRTFPDELSMTLSSLLASKRPELPQIADSLTSRLTAEGDLLPEATEGEASKGSPLAEEDPEIAEKIDLFKAKISRNAAVVPITLKRMNDCIAAINKLERYNGNIHLAFKRERTY